MPYIATDLDAFDDAQAVAGSTGLPPPQVLGGLALTWRYCWRNKVDRVTAEQLAAFFCSTAPGLPAALVAFGFLEATDTYRVRGVDRYLRLAEARRRGGLAAKSNLVPGARQRRKPLGTSPEDAQRLPGITSGSDSALSAKVEGRRSKVEETEDLRTPSAPPAAEVLALVPTDPDVKPPRKRSEAEEFWEWYQKGRQEKRGLLPEAAPDVVALRKWFKASVALVGLQGLQTAAAKYVTQPRDTYWQERGFPFRGFMSDNVWRQYVPPEERSG